MPALTVAEIAALCGVAPEGDSSRVISSASALAEATLNDIAFVTNKKLLPPAGSQAGCLIVDRSFDLIGHWALLRVSHPKLSFVRVLAALYPPKSRPARIHPTAVVEPTASIAPDSYIGPNVAIGHNTIVNAGCIIEAACQIGDNVTIGAGTTLHSGVTIYDRVAIGARVILHAGTVIGADGFGFTLFNGRYEKFPQVGTVHIEDDVEIGANCCIDRAALGVTRIGRGTKLDNLVHVAHNCNLGEHVVVAAQTGFSGSVVVGDFAVIGGQAGIGEKATIESKAIVGGKAGILTSATVHAGEPVWGIPARPLRKHLKGLANVARLPELKEQVQQLRQQIARLELEKEDKA